MSPPPPPSGDPAPLARGSSPLRAVLHQLWPPLPIPSAGPGLAANTASVDLSGCSLARASPVPGTAQAAAGEGGGSDGANTPSRLTLAWALFQGLGCWALRG